MTESLQSMLYRRLDEAPEERALGWYDPSGKTAWTTVQELMSRASGCAARLHDAEDRSAGGRPPVDPGWTCRAAAPASRHALPPWRVSVGWCAGGGVASDQPNRHGYCRDG